MKSEVVSKRARRGWFYTKDKYGGIQQNQRLTAIHRERVSDIPVTQRLVELKCPRKHWRKERENGSKDMIYSPDGYITAVVMQTINDNEDLEDSDR